ncbi:MAG: hypothetical protein ABFD75_03625 [Smithella sp.]
MKKITMAFITVLFVAGLASSALADPGWSNGHRFGNHERYDRSHHEYRHDYRDHRMDHQRVVVHRAPAIAPRPVPVVRVYEPQAAGFSLFLPGFSLQLR